jgi:hypothetical protein
VQHLSRLVVDPERFPDEREVMNSVGMGAVYTRTSTGTRLRAESRAHRAELIATLFEPYSQAMADLVDDRLAATGRAVIFDLHSFPKEPLPYEICLGADDRHTPAALLEAARELFAPLGSVAINQPFRGTSSPCATLRYGPLDASASAEPRLLAVGVIGTNETIFALRSWLERCRDPIPASRRSSEPVPRFPRLRGRHDVPSGAGPRRQARSRDQHP